MKIEAGEYYKTRDGRKVGLMVSEHNERYAWSGKVSGDGSEPNRIFQRDGLHGGTKYIQNNPNLDLIAEWQDGPVRTRTVTEIVPGVYGHVHVEDHPDAGIMVGIVTNNYSADELTAAIETLTQIRDALKENG